MYFPAPYRPFIPVDHWDVMFEEPVVLEGSGVLGDGLRVLVQTVSEELRGVYVTGSGAWELVAPMSSIPDGTVANVRNGSLILIKDGALFNGGGYALYVHEHAGVYTTPGDVAAAIAAMVDSAPETLDTLNELAAALGDDPNFATTVSTALGLRARKDEANTFIAPQSVQTSGVADVPLTLRSASGATANIVEAKDSSGTNRFTVSPAGYSTTQNVQSNGGIRVGGAVTYSTNQNWLSIQNAVSAPTTVTSGAIIYASGGQLRARTATADFVLGSTSAPEVRSDVQGEFSYVGSAPNGSSESLAVWTITRINLGVSPIVVQSASNVTWNDRVTATYS